MEVFGCYVLPNAVENVGQIVATEYPNFISLLVLWLHLTLLASGADARARNEDQKNK